ncbi:hypothetical protein NL676_016550 [Syzygium grande]|nr:hypothetical protein NL676_016550 [Syzygium grande]
MKMPQSFKKGEKKKKKSGERKKKPPLPRAPWAPITCSVGAPKDDGLAAPPERGPPAIIPRPSLSTWKVELRLGGVAPYAPSRAAPPDRAPPTRPEPKKKKVFASCGRALISLPRPKADPVGPSRDSTATAFFWTTARRLISQRSTEVAFGLY